MLPTLPELTAAMSALASAEGLLTSDMAYTEEGAEAKRRIRKAMAHVAAVIACHAVTHAVMPDTQQTDEGAENG